MKKVKKLSLKKEKISSLTNSDMQSIKGGKLGANTDLVGGSAGSSDHNFTCCWCTGGNDGTQMTAAGCPPDPNTVGPTTLTGQATMAC